MIGLGSTLVPVAQAGPRTLVSPLSGRIGIPAAIVEATRAHVPRKKKK